MTPSSGAAAWQPATGQEDAEVIRRVEGVLRMALAEEASDIHLEPGERQARVRIRVDGVLHDVQTLNRDMHLRIVSRLKILAKLDIAERRLPQDGHFTHAGRTPESAIDLRLSTLPTVHGEKAVLRILDSLATPQRSLDELGYEPEQLEHFIAAIERPYGMILVTGPTGSGKTVSLYASLRRLNRPGVNICTVEDPVEIQMPGVNQVPVHERAGLDFATAMRAFLRQDPDIMMVGEIRDAETADIAVKAAQTGHLLLATLHTNSAAATLERLLRMGVADYNLASSVLCITAQRLVRKLCVHCRQPYHQDSEVWRQIGARVQDLTADWQSFQAVGCPACRGTGYRGRTGIFEVLPIHADLRSALAAGANTAQLAALAHQAGRLSLREAGLLKVKRGITTLAEVLAVSND